MSRSVPLWRGATDDTPIPPRVKLRVFDRYDGKCCICGLSIHGHLLPAYDHRISIVNGGKNDEPNIQLLCSACHTAKTATDVHTKSVIYNKRAKRLKLKKRKLIPGSKGSGWRRKMDGTVVREK